MDMRSPSQPRRGDSDQPRATPWETGPPHSQALKEGVPKFKIEEWGNKGFFEVFVFCFTQTELKVEALLMRK